MSLHQLFCTNPSLASEEDSPFLVTFDPIDRNHIRALRLQQGEHIALVDGCSDYFEVEIVRIEGDSLWARIAQHLDASNTTTPVTLVQGLAKGEKMDAVLRQATELGIDAFAPASMKRSIVQLDRKKVAKRHERSCTIARSAALQSGRTTIPEVEPIRPFRDIVDTWNELDGVLLFWEEAQLEHSIRQLFTALAEEGSLVSFERFWIVIGPEGGIDPDEVRMMKESRARVFPLSLGPTILRTETAGVVASALTLAELRDAPERPTR